MCTAGCKWCYVNDAQGVQTGQPEVTAKLITTVCAICGRASRIQESYTWEWPEGNLLWDDPSVVKLLTRSGAQNCLVSSARVGLSFLQNVKGVPTELFFKVVTRYDVPDVGNCVCFLF